MHYVMLFPEHCDCKGYFYRGRCRHVTEVIEWYQTHPLDAELEDDEDETEDMSQEVAMACTVYSEGASRSVVSTTAGYRMNQLPGANPTTALDDRAQETQMSMIERTDSFPILDGEVIAEIRGTQLCQSETGETAVTYWNGDKPRGVYALRKTTQDALSCGHAVAQGAVIIQFFPTEQILCLDCAEHFDDEPDEMSAKAALLDVDDLVVTTLETISGKDATPLHDLVETWRAALPPDPERILVSPSTWEAIGRWMALQLSHTFAAAMEV
jgi:hypothetical protein